MVLETTGRAFAGGPRGQGKAGRLETDKRVGAVFSCAEVRPPDARDLYAVLFVVVGVGVFASLHITVVGQRLPFFLQLDTVFVIITLAVLVVYLVGTLRTNRRTVA